MRRILLVAMSGLIASCAGLMPGQQNPDADSAPAETVAMTSESPATPSVVDELYADIDGAVLAYREAMGLLESGSTEAAERLLSDSLVALDDLSARCREIAGCDLSPALQAYQDIASLQAGVFLTEPDELVADPDELVPDANADRSGPPAQINGKNLADLIVLNRQVKNAINGWLTWNRPLLMSTYENYQYLRADMVPAFEAAAMPEALLFGILAVESGGKVHAFSRVGAAGPLQFMRATGRRYGLDTGGEFDQRLDPARAAEASVKYLSDQFRLLDNSLEKVLAAYNSGENRVRRLNRRLKGKDFWSSEFYYALPRDTRDYVPKVLGAAWLYLHPEEYQLEFPEYLTHLEDITLVQEASLGELAICLGNADQDNGWFRTLRNLNPQVKPGDRIPAGVPVRAPAQLAEAYASNCPESPVAELAADLHEASYAEGEDLLPYVIQSGDTLSRIAKRHRCMSMREIAAMNNIPPPRYPLRAGKTIKVPNC